MKKIILLSLISFNLIASSDFYGEIVDSDASKTDNLLIEAKYKENPSQESIEVSNKSRKESIHIYNHAVNIEKNRDKVRKEKEREKRMVDAYHTDRIIYDIYVGLASSNVNSDVNYGLNLGFGINYIPQFAKFLKFSLDSDTSIYTDSHNNFILSPGIKYRLSKRIELGVSGDVGFLESYNNNYDFAYGFTPKIDIYFTKNISGFFKYSYLTSDLNDAKTLKLGATYHF